ncbi:MAG: glycosyltransferase family 2 protein [Anaerolineaceae bacterium]|nr:glycosyltransferase family 2 protein [Anaerolineaceae bacterium]
MNTECSIVIRAYNEEQHIGRLLTGIMKQTVRDVQIILVDSGSTDRTVEIASQYPIDLVSIRPQDFTFGKSLNLGIEQAKYDLIVMASAHVFPVFEDWLEMLLKPFADPKVALAYGKQRGAEDTYFSEHMIFQSWFPDVSRDSQSHPFCNNANSAIRKELWKINAYDESLTGLEDLAWANWAQANGSKISYVAEAEVVHVHQETWAGVQNRYRREAMAFKHIYPQEKFNFLDFLKLYSSNVIADLLAVRKVKEKKYRKMDILKFRLMQFWGTYLGYQQSADLTWQLKQAFYYPDFIPVRNENENEVVRKRINYSDQYPGDE